MLFVVSKLEKGPWKLQYISNQIISLSPYLEEEGEGKHVRKMGLIVILDRAVPFVGSLM